MKRSGEMAPSTTTTTRSVRLALGVAAAGVAWALPVAGGADSGAPERQAGEVGEMQQVEQVEEVVVAIGTRGRPRAVVDSLVPVDVFGPEDIESVNSSDMVDVVKTIVPSFNVERQPIADGASFIRPTKLRGLDSHHALILLDGKRRHRGAVLRLGAFGPHGVDIGGIPAIAIERVEVLRDGAAAQYGSDAIAGVIDFKLRSADSGFDLRARFGGYAQGDGEEATLEANAGFAVGDGGFLNLSAHASTTAPTNRSEPYDLPIAGSGLTPLEATRSQLSVDGVTYHGPDAFSYTYDANGRLLQVLPGSDGVPDDLDTRFADNYHNIGGDRRFRRPAQIWGQPERRQAMLVANAALPLAGGTELHGFATFSRKDQTTGFYYRRPGVSQLKPVRLADGSIYDPRASLYPAGFTPQFSGAVTDYAVHGGWRGAWRGGLEFDLSATYGRNKIRYTIENTLNPSLGPETPTAFHPGNLVNDELALNADFAWRVDWRFANPLSVAFGLEHRNEGYRVEEGDPKSYEVGPFGRRDPFDWEVTRAEVDADPHDDVTTIECRLPGFEVVGALCPAGDPVNNALPIGSNGFPGYPPAFASDVNRPSHAGYVDVEAELTRRWSAGAALRFERFDGFGGVAVGKLAARFRLAERVSLRAAWGTGFRAPTPGQISTTNVATRIGADGSPVAEGLFPATTPAAALFGATPLDAETSRSWTIGVAVDLDRLALTVDHYRIHLDDRITLSSRFVVGAGQAAQLAALGVPGAGDIAQVRFFTNDATTETRGVDWVATWELDGRLAGTSLRAAFNFNRTRLLRRGRFIGAESEFDIENGSPAMRGLVSARHVRGPFELTLRARVFGKHKNAKTARLEDIQSFGREVLVDVEAGWGLGGRYEVKLGAHNLFENHPDKARFETCCGIVYRTDSIVPWQGRLLYLRVGARFD